MLLRKIRLHRDLPVGGWPDTGVFCPFPKGVFGRADYDLRAGWRPHAAGALATYKNRLARSLAAVVNILDSDIIVLGGGISSIGALYGELLELIAEHAFSDGIRTPVVRAAHGDSSGVRGAAWLWPIET